MMWVVYGGPHFTAEGLSRARQVAGHWTLDFGQPAVGLEGWEGEAVSREAQGLCLGSARLAGTGSALGLLGSQGFPVPYFPRSAGLRLGCFWSRWLR